MAHCSRRRVLRAIAAASAAPVLPGTRAQALPSIRLVVPALHGATADRVAREVAGVLGRHLGASLDVQNLPGNYGIDGMDVVANAKPDGLTLGLASSTPIIVATLFKRQRSYDVFRDFTWVTMLATYANAMVVATRGARTLDEWIARAKADGKVLRYASAGLGSAGYFAGEFLRHHAGLNLVHDEAPLLLNAYPKLGAGTIDILFDGVASAMAQTPPESGRRILAVTSAKRHPRLPDAAAFGELSPEADFQIWSALVAPPRLPESERVPLLRAAYATVNDAGWRARLVEMGVEPSQLVGKLASDFVEADFLRSAALFAKLSPAPR